MNDDKTVAALLADAVQQLRDHEGKTTQHLKEKAETRERLQIQLRAFVDELQAITKVLVEATFPNTWDDGCMSLVPTPCDWRPGHGEVYIRGGCIPGTSINWFELPGRADSPALSITMRKYEHKVIIHGYRVNSFSGSVGHMRKVYIEYITEQLKVAQTCVEKEKANK